jgi:hypothetical protein
VGYGSAGGAARQAELEQLLQREMARADEAAQALARAQAEAAAAAAAAAGQRTAELAGAQREVAALQQEVAQLRAGNHVASLFKLPSAAEIMDGLGLERVGSAGVLAGVEAGTSPAGGGGGGVLEGLGLRWRREAEAAEGGDGALEIAISSGDDATPAAAGGAGSASVRGLVKAASSMLDRALRPGAGGASARLAAPGVGVLRGEVGLRTWLLVGYLAVLHLALMLSFTHSTPHDMARLCEQMAAHAAAKGHPQAHLLP